MKSMFSILPKMSNPFKGFMSKIDGAFPAKTKEEAYKFTFIKLKALMELLKLEKL